MSENTTGKFKDQLVHLHQQFFTYMHRHSTLGVPLKPLVVMIQKYINIRTTDLYTLIGRSIDQKIISWDGLLNLLQEQIALRDQVNKLQYSQPSIIDVCFWRDPERILGLGISTVISFVKKKQTNIMKSIIKAEFQNIRLLVITLQKQIIYYDYQQAKIIHCLSFRYNNVQKKTIMNQVNSQKTNITNQYCDKVDPISKRSQDFYFPAKQIRNTSNSQDLKNVLGSMKKSRLESSVCSSSNNNQEGKRCYTDFGHLTRTMTRFGMNRLSKKQPKRQLKKIRNSDNSTIFRIMTEAPIENSIEFMKAFKQSRQSFEQYTVIEKDKILPQSEFTVNNPASIILKRNYYKDIQNMKKTSHQLSLKKTYDFSSKKNRISSRKFSNQIPSKSVKTQDQSSSNAYSILQKKTLEIQCISMVSNYLLVSLLNRQVRLYELRKTISGLRESLIFQKQFDYIVSYVLLYESQINCLFNIVVAKLTPDDHTKLIVFSLDDKMMISHSVYTTQVTYSPVFQKMLSLGVGGYSEVGKFFLLELNSTSNKSSEYKSIDTTLTNNESGERVSISSMGIHQNLINLYLGSKSGQIYIYDRFSKNIRLTVQVAKSAIMSLKFINNSKQILFWQCSNKVGIANSTTLEVSTLTSMDSNYLSLIELYEQNLFLFYGKRKLGLVELKDSEEKKFQSEKPLNIYNRRQKLLKNSQYIKKEEKRKTIFKYFIDNNHTLIIICSDGEIMVYDIQLDFIGSYFTLNYSTIILCKVCSSYKYITLLYDNNEIEVVNIYTQDKIINPPSSKQEIYDVFFCHSSIYCFGYLTTVSVTLMLFGYKGELLSKVKMKDLIGAYIKQRNLQIKFYKGALIIINIVNGEIIFFMKRTCSRKQTLEIGQPLKDVIINYESCTLSICTKSDTIIIYSLEEKSKKYQCKLSCEGNMAISKHCLFYQKGILIVLWSNQHQYCLKKYKILNSQCFFTHQIPHGRNLQNLSVCLNQNQQNQEQQYLLLGENLIKPQNHRLSVVEGRLKSIDLTKV